MVLVADLTAEDLPKEPPPTPVHVETLIETEIAESVQFVGIAAPSRRSTVGSPLPGRVMSWNVDAGQRVKEGAVLAKLRTRAVELQLAQAQAELKSRQASLAELKAGARPGEIAAARASEKAAAAAAEFAETNFLRTEKLMRQSGASKLEYDQARRQRDESKQQLINAQSTTQLLVDGPRAERIVAAEASVELQQQIVAEIQDRIERSQIRAPFDGVVVTELTEAGNWLGAGDAVAEIVALNPIEIRVFVPERYINRVHVGESCEVAVRAAEGGSWIGKIRYVVPQAEQPARTFPVIVEVENTQIDASNKGDHSLRRYAISAGMLANVKLPIGSPVAKWVIHKDALRLGGATPAVIVVEDVDNERVGTARRVAVHVVGTTENRVAIEPTDVDSVTGQTFDVGATIVTRGNESLVDGQKVRILSSSTKDAGAPPLDRSVQ